MYDSNIFFDMYDCNIFSTSLTMSSRHVKIVKIKNMDCLQFIFNIYLTLFYMNIIFSVTNYNVLPILII